MPRYFAPISQDELSQIIVGWLTKEPRSPKSDFMEPITADDYLEFISELSYHHDSIKKDLSKVIFDHENCFAEVDEDMSQWIPNQLVGPRMLDNGLSYIGVFAGGDWEAGLFYIIYWDGKNLRAYIPSDGNTWNKESMTAYGSEEERGGKWEDYEPDYEFEDLPKPDASLILNDIKNRIQPR